jgi:L-arabinose isomerase
MTARSFGGTIGYLYAIAWIWRSLHVPWTSVGRDRTKIASDCHGSPKFTSADTFQKVTLKEVIGKWNSPRGNENVSELVAQSAGKYVLTPDTVMSRRG